jgi:hypothetical protein
MQVIENTPALPMSTGVLHGETFWSLLELFAQRD